MSLPPEASLIPSLSAALHDPSLSLARRYRALFALKHHAALNPPAPTTQPAVDALKKALSTSGATLTAHNTAAPPPYSLPIHQNGSQSQSDTHSSANHPQGTPSASDAASSALLKHEIAYCLGQTRRTAQVAPLLRQVLRDVDEDPLVRHEAAEALGALDDRDSLELLGAYATNSAEVDIVRETCQISRDKIQWAHEQRGRESAIAPSKLSSIDPAPPFPQDITHSASIPALELQMLDRALPLFVRYRAMFTLRDLALPPTLPTAVPAVLALATGFSDPSPLFRHEIAFVFGQLSHPASIPALKKTLENLDEAAIVRHEAAEALGDLGDEEGVDELLQRYLHDAEPVVRHSIEVALDMAAFERSGDTEYAILPAPIPAGRPVLAEAA